MPLSARHHQQSDSNAVVIVIVVVLVLFFLSVAVWGSYVTKRDVVGYLDRAQVAADIDRIKEYLTKLDNGMIRYGMTQGHAAFIFKTPQNDMGSMYQSVQDLLHNRIPATQGMDRSSPEYQTALDDIRGICRELDINSYAFQFRLRHDLGWAYVGGLIVLMFGVIVFISTQKTSAVEVMVSIAIILTLLSML